MENQNVPFLNLNPTPQTPPPASKKKLILMVAGLLAVSGLTYILAGSNLFKGQLLLSEKNELEMSKIAEYVKPFSQGDDQWGLLTGQEEGFEVLENAPSEVLFWSDATSGDWKVLHADFTTLLDQETPRKINITDLSEFQNTEHVSSCINFGDGSAEVCNNNPLKEKNFEHIYEKAGEFPITLTAFDGEGFIDEQVKVVNFEATDEEKGLHADYELTIDADNYLEVTLTDTSSEAGVIRRCVSFGDDKPIECNRPLKEKKFKHTYDEPGTYGVLVSVFDAEDNKDVELRTITITEKKLFTADFEINAFPNETNKVWIRDTSVTDNAEIMKRCVNFGDDTEEVCEPNFNLEMNIPTDYEHTYDKPGNYNITFTVTDNAGRVSTKTKSTSISSTGADFKVNIDPKNPKKVTLVDTSVIENVEIGKICVDFGESNSSNECSTEANKSYEFTYQDVGSYNITLKIYDKTEALVTGLLSEKTQTVYIENPDPGSVVVTPDFIVTADSEDPKKLTFLDTSVVKNTDISFKYFEFDSTEFLGDMGFKGEAFFKNSLDENLEYTLFRPGKYNITFKIKDAQGLMYSTTKTINVEPSETDAMVYAGFTVTSTPTPENPYAVFIDHNSTAKNTQVIQINVDYGDGNKSEGVSVNGQEDRTHIYSGPGSYTITLTAIGANFLARDTAIRIITLEAVGPSEPESIPEQPEQPVDPVPADAQPAEPEPASEPEPEPEPEPESAPEVPDAPQAPEQEEPSEPSDLSASVLGLLFADTLSIGEENVEINYVVAKQGASVYFAALCKEGPDLVHITPITTEDIEATIEESDASNTASLDIEKGAVGCNKLSASEIVTNENAEDPKGDSVIDPIDEEEVTEELEEETYEEFDDFDFENDEDEDYGDDYGSNDDDFDFDDSDDSSEYEETECSDYVDNDKDGYIDIEEDPGCESLDDDDESNPVLRTTTECSDEKDNDSDGFKDTEDPGCQNAKDDDETNEEEVVQSDEIDLPACFAATDTVHTFTDIDELDSTYVIDTEANSAYMGRVKDFHGEPIFKGYGSNGSKMFKPYAPIRRDEAVKTVLLTTCYLDHLSYNGELDVDGVNFKDSEFKIKDYWAKELIYIATNAGLVENDDQFIPSGQVTRAEYLKMLLTAYAEITGNEIAECKAGDSQFIDVDASDWYCKYGVLAKELGISEGYVDAKGELRLNPKKVLTRSDAAIMLWNYYIAVENSDLDLEEANNAGGRILR